MARYKVFRSLTVIIGSIVYINLQDVDCRVSISGNEPVYADGRNTLNLSCTLTPPDPNLTTTWVFDRANHTTPILKITPKKEDDSKMVVCNASPKTGSIVASANVTLIVFYGPSAVTIGGNIPVFADGKNSLTLSCDAVGSKPAATKKWTKSGKTASGGATLVIDPVRETDNGAVVECTAQNPKSTAHMVKKSIVLTVYYQPHTKLNMTGYEGEIIILPTSKMLTLICSVSGGNPAPTITWSCPYGQLESTSAPDVTSKRTFPISSTMNGRTCKCSAAQTGTPWSEERTVTFVIHFGPSSIDLTINKSPLVSHDTVTFKCATADSNPAPKIEWYNGKEVVPDAAIKVVGDFTQSWTIRIDRHFDGRKVVCRTIDVNGLHINDFMVLDVKYGPHNTTMFVSPQIIHEGDDVLITCLTDSNPDPSYSFDTTSDQLDGTVIRNVVVIRNANFSHSGNYTCVTRNNYGTHTATVAINIIPRRDIECVGCVGWIVATVMLILLLVVLAAVVAVAILRRRWLTSLLECLRRKQSKPAANGAYENTAFESQNTAVSGQELYEPLGDRTQQPIYEDVDTQNDKSKTEASRNKALKTEPADARPSSGGSEHMYVNKEELNTENEIGGTHTKAEPFYANARALKAILPSKEMRNKRKKRRERQT